MRNTASIRAYMSLRTTLPVSTEASSDVTLPYPYARDSRSLMAARRSPLAFSAILDIARGSMSTPSALQIFARTFCTADAVGFLNEICTVSVLTAELFLESS